MAVKKTLIANPINESVKMRYSELENFLKDNEDYKASNICLYYDGVKACAYFSEESRSDLFFKLVKGTHMERSIKVIFTSEGDAEKFASRLHNLFKGNKDYVNSNICLNYDDYVVRIYITPESNTDIAFCFV